MKIKRYFASDIRQAIRRVRDEQGPDAVILSNRRVEGGVEIVAAIDYDESLFSASASEAAPTPTKAAAPAASRSDVGSSERALVDDHYHKSSAIDRLAPREVQRAEFSSAAENQSATTHPPTRSPSSSKPRVNPQSTKHTQSKPAVPGRSPHSMEWEQDPALVGMKNELRELRGLVEQQLSGFAWGNMERQHPLHARLMRQLMALGISAQESKRVARAVNEKQSFEQAWNLALTIMTQSLAITEDDILSEGGIVSLVGPTGVGKTTTIAKLAARYTLRHGAGRVALITTDNYRIGAQEQLRTFGQILGAPVYVAKNYQELEQTIEMLDDKELVLIDTAGMSPSDMRLTEQLSMLRNTLREVKCYLVLSANSQAAGLEASVETFKKVGLEGCIISKIDESASLGEVLSIVLSHNLPVAYISDGQQVPEDLHPARSQDLVSRCIDMAEKYNHSISDEAIELQFGKVAVNANV